MDNKPLAPSIITRIAGIALLLGAVFVLSLLMGRWLGKMTRQAVLAAWQTTSLQAKSPKLELKQARRTNFQPKSVLSQNPANHTAVNRQRNILLIGIDSFVAEEPRLEGVWMILYLRDLPHFMLVPIFPNHSPGDQTAAAVDQNLARLFKLEEDQTPGGQFVQALRDKDLWWNGYLILDRTALSEIISLTSGKDTAATRQLTSPEIPDSETAPMDALLRQAQLAQELCRNSSLALTSGSNRFPQLIAKASAYIRTDLDLGEITREVNSALRYGGGISCEFPSLVTAANLP
jgi:hypothetical protein